MFQATIDIYEYFSEDKNELLEERMLASKNAFDKYSMVLSVFFLGACFVIGPVLGIAVAYKETCRNSDKFADMR